MTVVDVSGIQVPFILLRPRTLATATRSARKTCDVPEVRFHDLEHFALTMAATKGASTKELMRRAGHASPAAALTYRHATHERDQAVATALDGLVPMADVVSITGTQAMG